VIDIERNFNSHELNDKQAYRIAELRAQIKYLAAMIESACCECREKSLALTKLEECQMWANASIAREDH
jgi:hypothetical protein